MAHTTCQSQKSLKANFLGFLQSTVCTQNRFNWAFITVELSVVTSKCLTPFQILWNKLKTASFCRGPDDLSDYKIQHFIKHCDICDGLQHRCYSTRQTLTFLVQALLLIENNELTVFVGLLQDVLALLNVAVIVLQPKEGGHQGHVGLNMGGEEQITQHHSQTLMHPKLYSSVCVSPKDYKRMTS